MAIELIFRSGKLALIGVRDAESIAAIIATTYCYCLKSSIDRSRFELCNILIDIDKDFSRKAAERADSTINHG